MEDALSTQRVRDQAATLSALEQRPSLARVDRRRNLETSEGSEACELSSLAEELEHAFDSTLELQPLEMRCATHGTKREDEAVGERGTQ